MKKIIILFSLLSHLTVFGQSEQNDRKGVVEKLFYTEFGGPGILFSANYDTRFKPNTRTGLGARIGVGFTIYDDETTDANGWYTYETKTVGTIPVGLNYVFGKPNSPSMFEVGGGVTFLTSKASILNYNDYTEGNLMGHFEFMYRRVPIDGGFSWRIGFVPTINPDGDIFPFAAVGLGFAFK
jgi:hypothetical protein